MFFCLRFQWLPFCWPHMRFLEGIFAVKLPQEFHIFLWVFFLTQAFVLSFPVHFLYTTRRHQRGNLISVCAGYTSRFIQKSFICMQIFLWYSARFMIFLPNLFLCIRPKWGRIHSNKSRQFSPRYSEDSGTDYWLLLLLLTAKANLPFLFLLEENATGLHSIQRFQCSPHIHIGFLWVLWFPWQIYGLATLSSP